MENVKTNQLLELSSQIFALSALFRNDDKGQSLDSTYREMIIEEFDNLHRQAIEATIDVTTVQHVKYALAAYMDEVILNSNWPGRDAWMSQSLQLKFFGEHSAGEGFFTRLSQLRQGGVQNTDILEVYYVCLHLGFEGIYRLQGLEKLLALQVDLESQIDRARGGVDSKLAPDALPEETIAAKVGREVPFWVLGSVTAALMFFIYLGFTLMINHQANKALTNITASLQSLKHEQHPTTQHTLINSAQGNDYV